MKQCYECGEVKSLSDFPYHPDMKDGHLNLCKLCNRRRARQCYANSIERYHINDKKRSQDPIRKINKLQYAKDSRKKHPERYKATTMLNNAVRDGRIKRLPCRICGNPKSEGHHSNYSKPLEVDWLCFACHREVMHRQVVG
jgi:hypothetical protein